MAFKFSYIAQRRTSQQVLNLARLCPNHDTTFECVKGLLLGIPLGFLRFRNGQNVLCETLCDAPPVMLAYYVNARASVSASIMEGLVQTVHSHGEKWMPVVPSHGGRLSAAKY